MVQSLCHCNHRKIDCWHNDSAGLCRVHSGVKQCGSHSQYLIRTIPGVLSCLANVVVLRTCEMSLSVLAEPSNMQKMILNYASVYTKKRGSRDSDKLTVRFLFASVLDLLTKELILAADRFASRPLFYAQTPKGFILFSNQVSSILKSADVPREVDMQSMFELIATQAVQGVKTLNKAVHMVPPGTAIRFKENKCDYITYWEGNYNPENKSIKVWSEELAETIKIAVRRNLRGNHRFGLLLSGGMDSRMVLAAAEKELTCYTFGDYENKEYHAARRVAQKKGFKSVFVQRYEGHYSNTVDPAIEIGSGMYAFNHAHAIGFMEKLHSECDVMLHGLATEPYFRDTKLPTVNNVFWGLKGKKVLDATLTEKDLPSRLFRRHFSLLNLYPQQLFTKKYAELFEKSLLLSAEQLINEAEPHCKTIYEKYSWPETHYYSKNPPFPFAISLRPFITERNIICDNDLLDLHFRMPATVRLNSKVWIKAMKLLDPKLASIPDANTGFRANLPSIAVAMLKGVKTTIAAEHIIPSWLPGGWRLRRLVNPKQHAGSAPAGSRGSYPNFDSLIRRDDRLRDLISDTLNDPECLNSDIFDIDRIKQLFEEHLQGRANHRYFLFILITFGRWHKKYGRI